MDDNQLVELFNPANAKNLTPQDLQAMQELTDEQLAVLAKHYPNTAHMRSYLVLYDKNVAENKQIYPPSTWQNLHNVRRFANRKSLVPYTFTSLFMKRPKAEVTRTIISSRTAAAKKRSVDLTPQEAAAELKKSLETPPNPWQQAAQQAQPAAIPPRGAGGRFQKAGQAPPQTGSLPADQDFDNDDES